MKCMYARLDYFFKNIVVKRLNKAMIYTHLFIVSLSVFLNFGDVGISRMRNGSVKHCLSDSCLRRA